MFKWFWTIFPLGAPVYFAENVPEFMLGYLRNIYIATNGNGWGVDVGIIRTESSKIII